MPLMHDAALRARKPRRAKTAAPRLAMAARGGGVAMRLAGAEALMLPEGALWLEGARTLVVSDLHFEKATAYAMRGHLLPPYDTRATLERLAALAGALQPARIVSLGDAFHDRGGPARLCAEDRAALSALMSAAEWIWIEGNHDGAAPAALGGCVLETLELEGLVFRHEPRAGPAEGEVSGHLHPCARVASPSGSVRRRCFATDGARLVMPAFGAYAGGLNVRDEAFTAIFPQGCYAMALGKERVYPAAPERLLPDA
ncbi:MAG: ligase-associated DNA damage response endonuclease PdeM [Hyphomonadaceae bacterium]